MFIFWSKDSWTFKTLILNEMDLFNLQKLELFLFNVLNWSKYLIKEFCVWLKNEKVNWYQLFLLAFI